MLFDEIFLANLANNPVTGIFDISRIVMSRIDPSKFHGWDDEDYEMLLETYALLSSLEDAGLLSDNIYIPNVTGSLNEDCSNIFELVCKVNGLYTAEISKLKVQSYKSQFRVNFNNVFSYEFSQGDLDRIQTLVNELREHVSKSGDFEDEHKRRLLSRLEKLQSELHKKMSDLDKFWGLIGDAGVAVGKFGNDVKPIVERIKEITEIVWRTQARAEELPSDSPLPKLEDKSES